MQKYYFKAITRKGEQETGVVEALSQELASRELRSRGLTLVSLQTGTTDRVHKRGKSRSQVSRADILSFTNELAVLLRSGVPLDRGLKILSEMSQKKAATELLETVLDGVKGGKRLSQALEPYEPEFGSFYLNMLRSGETSGGLAPVLENLAEYLEKSRATRDAVVSAMIYPSLLLVVTVVSVIAMLGFVVPQFEMVFADMGDGLPSLTRLIIGLADGIKDYGLYMLALVIILGYFIRNWLATEAGKLKKDAWLLKVPVVGGIIFEYEVSKFARTTGTLLTAGVPMLDTISIATNTVGNEVIRNALKGLPAAIKSGTTISLALDETQIFTPKVVQMTRVGEEAGSLNKMMLELAKVFDSNVQAGIKRGLTLLEPLLIVCMGGMIALIMAGIMMGTLAVNQLVI